MPEPIRIRKYPNRRLYDTSRSKHLTHDGVLAIIAEGHSVQVTDSRSGVDITNAVLLQILIERDPQKIASLPSELILRAMRSSVNTLRSQAEQAIARWPDGEPEVGAFTRSNHRATPAPPTAATGVWTTTVPDLPGRPKARMKHDSSDQTASG